MLLLDNVSKCYEPSAARAMDAARAVDTVSFSLPDQTCLVISGHSGSGKTTLLRLIAGLEVPDTGRILFNDRIASTPGWVLPPHQRQVGFLFQTPVLWPHLTVYQNISFGLGDWDRRAAKQRMDEILEQTKLTALAGRHPHQLSGGEARRVSLARALAPKPACLLLDEPLTHLDPDLKAEMLTLILETARSVGASLIYVTHDATEGQLVSNWTGCMSHGRLTLQPFPDPRPA